MLTILQGFEDAGAPLRQTRPERVQQNHHGHRYGLSHYGFHRLLREGVWLSLRRHVRDTYCIFVTIFPLIFFQTDTAAVHARSFISSCSFPSTTSSSPTCSRHRRAPTGGTFSTFASVNALSCAWNSNKVGTWDCRLLGAVFLCTYFQMRSVTRQLSAALNLLE